MAFIRQIGSRASEDRLELLIEERLRPKTDKDRIDKRIWNLFGEKWAVLYTDLSGFHATLLNSASSTFCKPSMNRTACWCR